MTRQVFTPLLLILIGSVMLLNNFGIISGIDWHKIFQFWPVLFILWGISLIFNQGFLSNLLIFSLIILVVFLAIFSSLTEFNITKQVYTQNILNNNLNVISIDFGAANFDLKKGSNNVYDLSINHSGLEFSNEYVETNDSNKIMLKQEFENIVFSNNFNDWTLLLNTELDYIIELNYGVSDALLDLTDLKVEKLMIGSGVSNTKLILTDYPTKVSIESGVTNFDINIPKDYQARVRFETGISSKDLDSLKKIGGYYFTQNFDESQPFIDVLIESGISNIDFDLV